MVFTRGLKARESKITSLTATTTATHQVGVAWTPGPEARGILKRTMQEAERSGSLSIIKDKQFNRPMYVVYEGVLVKPRDLWAAWRAIIDGNTDAPEDTTRRAAESFKTNNPDILTGQDCTYAIAQWRHIYYHGNG